MEVVSANPQMIWVEVEPAEVIRVGSVVGVDTATPLEGVQPIPVAAGASNTTNKDIPFGVVVGTNNTAENEEFDSTNKCAIITQVAAGAVYGATKQYTGVGGPYSRNDPQAFVKIALIDPTTILRARIFNAAVGTAPTAVAVSTTSGGDGIGCSTAAVDVAPIANFATMYIRSGANAGVYRTLTSTSTTAHTWLKAVKSEIAIGDTLVAINGLRPYGLSKCQFDAEALYIDCSAALTSDNFHIDVVRLDLSVAGNEYVDFRFNADNFCSTRG